jgi:hypothetical protein
VQTQLIAAIEGRLKELKGEINKLEGAMESLISDGHRGGRGGRAQSRGRGRRQSGDGRAPRTRGRRRRPTRMDQRERQAQALNRIREHGSQGVTITALATEMGVTRSYLYGRILPPLDAEITRTRGRVAPKT